MLHRFLLSLYQRWQIRSLGAKLLLPIVGLMLISLLGSTLVFVAGTALTRNRLLKQQIAADAERVTEAINARVEIVTSAATMLTSDPRVFIAAQEDSEEALSVLNSQAVVVRDRFGLDLIQIYDQQGEARTNLMLSSLYHESSLLGLVKTDAPVVRVVKDRVLLLSRVAMPGDGGTVIAGVDLETELQRLVSRYRLSADLGLSVANFHVGARAGLPFESSDGQTDSQYSHHLPLTLGETPVDLLLVRPTTAIAQVTNTGLNVMVGSMLLTTLLLMGLSAIVIRAIVRPIRRLSAAATVVSRGNLNQQMEMTYLASPFGIGNEDEIGLLAATFNSMVAELRGLYQDLEAKVEARTGELATAAEVASAVSSSLDLDVVLQTSVQLIQERLGFYYVGICLIGSDSNALVLRGATGEAGQLLKAEEFQLAVGSRSLVGAAAATGQPRVVQDVMTDPVYLELSQLPATKSEVAIPLLVGQTVIGVLDVQSAQHNSFTPETVKLLSTLADQIATGVHNAQLYTQQRQMAEHLAAVNARLQELDRTKDEFIQNVSHELRTPLALIRDYVEMLEGGMLSELKEEQRQPVTIIARRCRVMTKLVEDITTLLEIEARPPEMALVSLSELAQTVVEDFYALAERNRLALHTEIAPNLPPVMGEERYLHRVVDNLVNNALKFTPAGGVVTVQLFKENGRVILQVSDDGIGIPAEKQARVFERFYQVDGSARRRYGGAGLGLALVKEVVEAHGGQVTLESELERGSSFRVAIPVEATDG